MEWLQNLLSGENGSPIQLVIITLLLMAGLILIVWVFRRIAGSPSRRAARNRIPRLSITDSTMVDDKRYLVLVRRDNVEHLVLIGGPTDVVVESGIMRLKSAEQPAGTNKHATPEALAVENKATHKDPILPVVEKPAQPLAKEVVAPIAGATAIGTAATAGAVTSTASATPSPATQKEVATSKPDTNVSAGSSDIPETMVNDLEKTLADTADVQIEADPTPASTIVKNDSSDPDAESSAVQPDQPIAQDTPPAEEAATTDVSPEEVAEPAQVDEANLEDAITAQLDDALSGEDFSIAEATSSAPAPEEPDAPDPQPAPDVVAESTPETVAPPVAEADPAPVSGTATADDEMQRLLEELAGETKEPA